jgi:pimeloyl-ACP methyl ester carboxylesterase
MDKCIWDASTTWNQQAWQVDQTLTRLMRAGIIGPTLVVSLWNADEHRRSEYFPQKHLQCLDSATRDTLLREALRGRAQADAYLRFLVEELKPLIDQRYPTLTDSAHTAIMGSSMGGMISVYALCEYPQVFGRAAGLSTIGWARTAPTPNCRWPPFATCRSTCPRPKGIGFTRTMARPNLTPCTRPISASWTRSPATAAGKRMARMRIT